LQTVMAALNATDKISVSFNGQSFSRSSVDVYQRQLVYWQAAVIREQTARDAARGIIRDGRIAQYFVIQ